MKQRKLIKRIIAVILTLAVLVTGMLMTTVYAATGDDSLTGGAGV